MGHIYLRVLPPEAENPLSTQEIIDRWRSRTQFIDDAWFTLKITPHDRGGLYFAIDDSSIDLEEVVHKLNSMGYILVM